MCAHAPWLHFFLRLFAPLGASLLLYNPSRLRLGQADEDFSGVRGPKLQASCKHEC
jgi:hypothetical protein